MINYDKWFTMDVTSNIKITKRVFSSATCFIYLAIIVSSPAGLAENICMTRECNETAAEIARNIDSSVLPCDNFYQFACGKLIRNIDRRRETQISSLIQSYLEHYSHTKKNQRFRKAFTLYRLCKDQNANAGGLDYLRQIIKKLGGWPMVEGENWQKKNWENVTGELSQLNYNSGIFFYPKMIAFPRGLNSIMLEPMPFKLSNESAEDLTRVAIKLGANPSKINAQSFMDILSNFEHLNKFTNGTYPKDLFTIYRMKLKWPSIDWMTYFTGYFSSLSTITINQVTFVHVNEEYVDEIVKVIEETSRSVIMDYVIAQIVEKLLPYLRPEIIKTSEIKLKGEAENSLQVWNKFCADVTTQELPKMAHALLYVNYFDGQIQNEFVGIGEALKNKMGELIRKANWLNNETIGINMERLSSLTYGISNFNTMTIDEYIDEYNDLILDESNFYHAMWSIVTFQQNYPYQKLLNISSFATSQPRFRRDFREHINEFEGVYYPEENRVDLYMGAILNPFFKNNCPRYINYGGLGLVLGHEIAHGFSLSEANDYTANYGDSNAVIRNEFLNRIDCFVRQYDKINLKLKMPINGTMTVAENIADYIGIKLAYSIYEDWMKENPLEPKLYHLNYTSMQMFWISLAQNQCIYGVRITNGPDDELHSPEQYRLNGALSNIPKFSEAFKCSSGSPMNPSEKCILW